MTGKDTTEKATSTRNPWDRRQQPVADPGAATSPKPFAPASPPTTPATDRSTSADVADFLQRVRDLPKASAMGRGRLVFAMDATMSRQPTWDMALALQAEMFDGGEGDRRARCAARLFPRRRRMPGLEMGGGP